MGKVKEITLDEAVEAARQLPADAQAEIANELMEHVEDISTADRSPQRQAVIAERLQGPLREISRDEVMAMLRRYNPAI